MEPQGLVSDASWSFFDPSMAAEESEMMVNLFGSHQYINDQDQENSGIGVQPVFWSDYSADNSYYSENTNYNPYSWSQGNWSNGTASNNINFLHSFSNSGECYLNDTNIADEQANQTSVPLFQVGSGHRLMEAVMNEETRSDEITESMEPAALALPASHSLQSMKRRLHPDDTEKPVAQVERDDNQLGRSKKKARASPQVPKKGKNAQSKRQQKSTSGSNEADNNADMNTQSSSCYSSEDDESNAPNGAGATSSSSKGSNPNGKARAGRGSATDPQSLYARKRRERINERLRILQNLVPNGTKVDISTMLEEAVQYVKFLQLQIKLLSSDEMWMYAPIAYNGMNLGIELKISAPSNLAKGSDSTVGTQR